LDAWTSGVRLVGGQCSGPQRLPHTPRLRAHARRVGGKQEDRPQVSGGRVHAPCRLSAEAATEILVWLGRGGSEPVAVVRRGGMPSAAVALPSRAQSLLCRMHPSDVRMCLCAGALEGFVLPKNI